MSLSWHQCVRKKLVLGCGRGEWCDVLQFIVVYWCWARSKVLPFWRWKRILIPNLEINSDISKIVLLLTLCVLKPCIVLFKFFGLSHNEEFYNLYASTNNITVVISSKQTMWAGYMSCTWYVRQSFEVLFRKAKSKRPFPGRSYGRYVMKLCTFHKVGLISWLTERLLTPQEILCSLKLGSHLLLAKSWIQTHFSQRPQMTATIFTFTPDDRNRYSFRNILQRTQENEKFPKYWFVWNSNWLCILDVSVFFREVWSPHGGGA